MKVKNLKGTIKCTCCNSWLNHWENWTNKKADRCAALGCGEKATLGGHVIKAGDAAKTRYITPICDACNKLEDEYELKAGTILAPATKQATCKK